MAINKIIGTANIINDHFFELPQNIIFNLGLKAIITSNAPMAGPAPSAKYLKAVNPPGNVKLINQSGLAILKT